MKAACVLVCLALAHGITASIFKQQQRQVDGLDVQQLDNIDQYQVLQHDQSVENQKQRVQTTQNLKKRGQKVQNQKNWEQPAQQSSEQETQQRQEQLPQTSQYQQTQQNQQVYREQYQQAAANEWPHTHQHSHSHRRQHDKTYRPSSSSESSQDTSETIYYGNQPVLRGDNWKWNSPLFNTVLNKDNQNAQVYGQVIEWDNLMDWLAVEPKTELQKTDEIEKIFGDAQAAMKHISEEERVKYHQVYELAQQQNNEDAELNATQLAQKYQYPIEEYIVPTDDGYVLTVFRIPPKKQVRDVQKRPVVFLMHGILGSADDWLLMGPEKSLAFMLSDAGYDVWLGNARGNKYSRRHLTRYPVMADYWQFSNDEIALHDLPAMIDFALETTKQEKLFYIGHAQGTTAFFALTATRPEYNDKIIMMYALSPMVYMTNVRSPLFRMIAPTSKYEHLRHQIGNEAFTPSKGLIQILGGAMCQKEIGCKMVCSNINFVMSGVDVDGMDYNIIPVVLGHLPAGTSAKVIKQYAQGVSSNEFRRYNYGPYINEQIYGTMEAPKYNITQVQAPVTLYYSEEDWLAHPKDVVRLQNELPNVREAYKVPEEHFSHMDFQFSKKAPEMVYQRLIASMQNQQ
ncbi:hypothetical protein B5X24_HaOG200585 [Helicoverpa armigera]|uniref:Partial AB-hydrolase lipase domain-containing protein n=1 Tax=Helicoverpa armigera TaxID=29058 RepID=A0A2W1BHK8_HELAM|nr:hypothetical protein B5X24_HaOG200585 [Helicoverpa armigera]